MTADVIFSVRGKVVFITGAAQGLGYAMAEVLVQNGAILWLFDRDVSRLEDARQKLQMLGGEVKTYCGDVTDQTVVEAAISDVISQHGRLDVAIANAGVSDRQPGLLHASDPTDWAEVLEVNLNGVYYTCRAALAAMVGQQQGKIITVASMWGLAGPAGAFPRSAYAASKGAVVNLTREIALQYAQQNIQINALCPGIFQTENRPRDPAASIAYTPMGRLGRPEEIKGATLFLASSASDFMTGQTLVIDGGVLAR